MNETPNVTIGRTGEAMGSAPVSVMDVATGNERNELQQAVTLGDFLPKSRKTKAPVLVINKNNSYYHMPIDKAQEAVRDGRLEIVNVGDPDYVEGTKKALGRPDGFNAGQAIQTFGHSVHAEDIGKLDSDKVIRQAEEAAKKFKADKANGLVSVKELPPDLTTFEGKKKRGRPKLRI